MTAVRQATRTDVPEIVRVINLAFRVEDFFIDGDRTDADDVMARMDDPEGGILVLDGDMPGTLAAVACVHMHDGRGHFAMLSVDPVHQRRGLARLMLTSIENHCRTAGCHALDLHVVNLREELPPFYETFGFIECGTEQFNNDAKLRPGWNVHLVKMTKSLLTD